MYGAEEAYIPEKVGDYGHPLQNLWPNQPHPGEGEDTVNTYPDDSDPDGDEVDAAGTYKG